MVSMAPAEDNPPMRNFIGDNDISRKNRTRKGSSFLMGGGKQRNGFSEEIL